MCFPHLTCLPSLALQPRRSAFVTRKLLRKYVKKQGKINESKISAEIEKVRSEHFLSKPIADEFTSYKEQVKGKSKIILSKLKRNVILSRMYAQN